MLRYANNKHQAYIAATGVTYAGGLTTASGTKVTKDNLPTGAVALVDLGNVVIDSAANLTAVDRFKIVQSRGPSYPLTISPIIEKGSATVAITASPDIKVSGVPFAAKVQQETIIGYDGTNAASAPIDANINDLTSYYIVIEKEDNDSANNRGYWPAITGQYKTDSTASAREVILNLADSVFQNTLFEAGDTKYIRVATVFGASGGVVSDPPTINSLTSVSRGSKVVTVPNWTGMVQPVAGDVISLVSGGVTDYYEVATSTATSVTLTTQYRGTTSTVADIALEVPTGTQYWGISLKGVQPPFDVLRNRNYAVNRFFVKAMTDDSIATALPVTKVTAAYEGVGTWEQAAMDEFLSWGFLGNARAIVDTPPGVRPATVVENASYSIIQLVEKTNIPAMTSFSSSAMSHLIYVENTTAGGGTLSGQGTTLATIFGGLTLV